MSASIEEISKRAGVGPATTYRVLSGRSSVKPQTRVRVLRAVEELGLPRMRSRTKRRGGVVLWGPLAIGELPETFSKDMYGALEAAMARRGRALRSLSCPLPDAPDEPPVHLLRENIEGIMTVGFYSTRHIEAMAERWPTACLLSTQLVPGAISVSPDYADAARQAVEHLLARGHRRIGLVTGKLQPRNFSRLAFEGYTAALAAAGVPADPGLVHSDWNNLDYRSEKGRPLSIAAGHALLGRSERATAIILREDSLRGIQDAAEELNLRVPRDVSLVVLRPQREDRTISAVEFSPEEMVELALKAIGSAPAAGARILLPVVLREGASVRRLGG